MIWILLLYVLPLAISILGWYFFTKSDGGTVAEFLEVLPWLFIPIFNILALIGGLYILIEKWIKDDESIQNFLDKKL
jgi:hypothetical protein